MAQADPPPSLGIMSRARELAATGKFESALEIQAELLREGQSDAPIFLNDGTIQLELRELCARARTSRPAG